MGDLGEPVGSALGYRRPVLVVQCDAFNDSRIATVLCVPLTSNVRRADERGNVLFTAGQTGLGRGSAANVSLTVALDRGQLVERVGQITRRKLDAVFAGIDVVLGR